jgi:N2-citryl-N6-acetyl-N6-hydroxylysine synthase
MKLSKIQRIDEISLRSFMNSFIRDYSLDERVILNEDKVSVVLNEGLLNVFILKYSLLGSHHFSSKIELDSMEIDFELCATLIARNFSSNKDISTFLDKVKNSKDNLYKILSFDRTGDEEEYLTSEKSLLNGHPFHPYPKAKWGMNSKEVYEYSPEFVGEFKLVWVKISKKDLYSNISLEKTLNEISKMVSFDFTQEPSSKDILIPMHPWQVEKILEKTDKIKIVGHGINSFYALSSMRSTYCPNAEYQLKFSMDIGLTNSIRHLQANESDRGRVVKDIINDLKFLDYKENFSIQFEPFFIGIKDSQGNVIPSTIVQFRENAQDVNDLRLLSSLCESFHYIDKPIERKNWFKSFLNNVISHFFELAIKEGIYLGAHLQNILVRIKNDIPVGCVYRDCQGTGFHTSNLKKYKELSRDNGNILDDDEVNKVFGYYLVVNTIFSTISSLADSDKKIELELLADFRTFLLELKYEYKDENLKFIDYLLNSKTLYQKGNMRCCLLNLNENTIDNPWRIYNKISNPLQHLRPLTKHKDGILYEATTKKGHHISLRELQEDDLNIFYQWHHKDFVKEFWELDKSKDELLDYIRKVKSSSYQLPILLEINEQPAGYFEAYWAFEDRIAPYCNPDIFDRGIHLLIGEEKFLRTRLVYDSIFHVTKYLLEDNHNTKRVWGEPRADNKSILHFAQKLPGWKFIKEFDFPHKKAALLCCEKNQFYSEVHDGLL